MTIKQKLDDFDLTDGERILIKGLGSGEPVAIGATSRPSATAGEDRQITAAFLRYVLTGGCEKLWEKAGCKHLPEKGLRIEGARIIGELDLEGVKLDHDLALLDCHFDEAPLLRSMRLENLALDGAFLPGLSADRLEARGGFSLCDVKAKGEILLRGADLGGDLICEGARMETVRLQGARVDGGFFLREEARVTGLLDLSVSRFGSIVDAEESWPGQGNLVLDGCQYHRFSGTGSPVTAEDRIRWLDLQDPAHWGVDFWPQPWEQCARVLREMGHAEDARKVLIAKEKRQRVAHRERLRKDALFEDAFLARLRDGVLRWVVGYGYRPIYAALWLAGFWLLGAIIFYNAYQHDAMKPADTRSLYRAEWTQCARSAACFVETGAGASYPRFNALIYSADTLLPVVNLEVQDYWIPASEAGGWGVLAQYFLWTQIIAGWALSLLAIAGFSGLIRRD